MNTNEKVSENEPGKIAPPVLYLLVFFGGFANLAAEIIGPRMFASLFGNTTTVWAVMISVTLVGLSVGYTLGGRIQRDKARNMLVILLLINAAWLLIVAWVVWEVPNAIVSQGAAVDASLLLATATGAFFPPSVLFGMISPTAITLLSAGQSNTGNSETTGNVYAVGTIGSVAGALAAAFYLIPWVGLTASLQLFSVGLLIFAAYLWQDARRYTLAGGVVVALIFPQPGFTWRDDDGLDLLAQREGYYQTVRVYGDDDTVTMHLGPTFHSRMDRATGEPTFSYARTMLDLIGTEIDGQTALVIGGAGHSLARWLESHGAVVTEVEIDPIVVELSDEHFGSIDGEVVIQDGRVYVEGAPASSFDLIIVDAFDGAATVPPQLTTLEFFEAATDALTPDGRLYYNFIGTPQGDRNRSFRALATTMDAAFGSVGARSSRGNGQLQGDNSQNVIFVASQGSIGDLAVFPVPDDGTVLTDDKNPMDIFLSESRSFTYFRR
jgi:spermidine synthase